MYYFNASFILLIFVSLHMYQVSGDCDRSRFILGAEDICWSRKVEIVDRIQYTQKRIMNFAKKKLGMESDEKDEPQKCDYYYCIFNEMKLLNPEYDVPCVDRTSKWVKKNVIYNDAEILLNRIQMCSGELGNSLGAKLNFLADNVDLPADQRVKTSSNQSKCEIGAEYMKCLAKSEKNLECPVFLFP